MARGRLAVLKTAEKGEEGLDQSKILYNVLSRCLLCGACTNVCANKVPVSDLVIQARARAREKNRYPLAKRIQSAVLTSDGPGGDLLRRGGRLAKALACGEIEKTSGLHLRFPAPFFSGRRVIPNLAPKSWMETALEREVSTDRPNVGFFAGCGTNHIFTDAARALERLAQIAGINLITVRDQGCCGLPAYASGDLKAAEKCAARNLDAFSALDLDAVVTTCASCGSQLLNLPDLFPEGSERHEQAKKLAGLHMDAAQYLAGVPGFEKAVKSRLKDGPSQKVYYHAPCHTRFGRGVTDAPFRLLSMAAPPLDLIPTEGLTQCCGHGGGFNLSHYDLSGKIHQACITPILAQEPDVITTGCTGCLLQFTEGVYANGKGGAVAVRHPLVVLDGLLSQ